MMQSLRRVGLCFNGTKSVLATTSTIVNKYSVRSKWSDDVRDGFKETVGKTPLIRLNALSEETGCEILAKAEFMNPGGSVKDRPAAMLISDAERKGLLRPGGVVVEGTAGNTGIGLAHMCNALGYRCVIYMPNTQSQEKIDTLKMLGADVRPVPAVPFSDPKNYNHQAQRFADATENAYWTNQFDAFTCATGTGGTLAGTGRYLKEQNSNVKIVLADPPGSVLFHYIQDGELIREGDGSITEGIGQGRVTGNLSGASIDSAVHIPDIDSVKMTFRLLHEEGLLVGASSGLNVSAAVNVAQQLGPGHKVVTILCDSGSRYAAKLFNKSWLEEKGFLDSIDEKWHPQD